MYYSFRGLSIRAQHMVKVSGVTHARKEVSTKPWIDTLISQTAKTTFKFGIRERERSATKGRTIFPATCGEF